MSIVYEYFHLILSAIGLAIKNDESVSRRQAQSYNLHLKRPAGGVKGNV